MTPGLLVEHTVWGRGKVVEVVAPYFIAHFPTLSATSQGPRRKLQLAAVQVSIPTIQSDPVLDLILLGPQTHAAKATSTRPRAHAKPTLHSLDQTIDWFTQT